MRKPMITRTIDVTTVRVMGLNTNTQEVINLEIEVSGSLKDERLLKFMNDNYAPADTVFVQASKVKESSILYGMSEAEFIKHAKVLPPR